LSKTISTSSKTIYLAIIWHQHQPLYVDAERKQLSAPWVRTHGTKDYYDMCAMLKVFPSIHCTFNLTSTLLQQLEECYIEPLSKIENRESLFVNRNTKQKRNEETNFTLRIPPIFTDPWINLMLKPTETFGEEEKNILYRNAWSAIATSEVQLQFFPEYERLCRHIKNSLKLGVDNFSTQQLLDLKFWFFLANFDVDFLLKEVPLANGTTINLSDLIERRNDGKYYLRKKVTEVECNRLVLETFKVLSAIVPLHKEMQFKKSELASEERTIATGQIELTTTPLTHPILPLLFNSEIAKVSQPKDKLPPPFQFPEDAQLHVKLAVEQFKQRFGIAPAGMWPSEGCVSQEILPLFAEHNIHWIATDEKILFRSKPEQQLATQPYSVQSGGKEIAIFFRNTRLSDKIGFDYQNLPAELAAEDFIQSLHSLANENEQLITVIVDGENAWEWYRTNLDGKDFLRSLYKKLEERFLTREIITVTPSEYIFGNAGRGIPPHPISAMKKIEWLFPGSWINANFDTWIGEEEENTAWEYLLRARNDLKNCGIALPTSFPLPDVWKEMLAAEGSDWFWWYGTDQNAPGGDEPFDEAFRKHLKNVYYYANQSGANLEVPEFPPILFKQTREDKRIHHSQGTMARSDISLLNDVPFPFIEHKINVTFFCRVNSKQQNNDIYIVGNRNALGNWMPNIVLMTRVNEMLWKFETAFFPGEEIQYKYTFGDWSNEEFPLSHRTIFVPFDGRREIVIENTFGIL
jgi:alpha-amylase/alpha-mannosidase (GH57 family)